MARKKNSRHWKTDLGKRVGPWARSTSYGWLAANFRGSSRVFCCGWPIQKGNSWPERGRLRKTGEEQWRASRVCCERRGTRRRRVATAAVDSISLCAVTWWNLFDREILLYSTYVMPSGKPTYTIRLGSKTGSEITNKKYPLADLLKQCLSLDMV